jgi:hypothetical protein
MHCNNIQNNGIWTQKSAYRDSPIGKLKESSLVRTMPFSLQQGFDCDSKTGFSVRIDCLTAFALEQGIVGRMPLPNSTAVGTPFAGVPTINYVQGNAIVKASLFEDASKLCEGNSHYYFVESPTLATEFCNVFNGNVGIESLCQFDYFTNNLSKIGFDEITFSGFEPCKLPDGIDGLQNGSSSHKLLPSCPDMLPEVGLVKHFSSRSNNRNGKAFGVDVNSKHVLPLSNCLFFGKKSDNLPVRSQTKGFASPAISNKGGITLEVPVLFDGNGNPLARNESKFNEEVGFGVEGFAVSGNVELDCDFPEFIAFRLGNIALNIADNLTVKRGVFLAC